MWNSTKFWTLTGVFGCLLIPFLAFAGVEFTSIIDLAKDLQSLAGPSAVAHRKAIQEIAASGDKRYTQLLDDYRTGNLYAWKGKVVLAVETYQDDQLNTIAKLLDPLTRQPLPKSPSDNKGLEVRVDQMTSLTPGGKSSRL